MHYEQIDVIKHRKYIVPFRKDSFIASFGTDKDFGNEEDYLNWLEIKKSQFPEGFVLVMENTTPSVNLNLQFVNTKDMKLDM